MSAQSIKEVDEKYILSKIDSFYICEGNLFRNIIDYDLNEKVNYKKLNLLSHFKKLICNKKEVLLIIDKILK